MHWVLETERLLLRRFTEADAEALLHMESNPEVLRHVGRGPLADVEAYRQHIQSRLLPYYDRPEGFGGWVIIEKASGEFLGGCSLKPALDSRTAVEMGFSNEEVEVGYGLRHESWGKGYATELARALVRKAFTELGAACVVASVTIANRASVRVLEKAGLRRVGEPVYLPGEDEASVKYAVTREQFDRSCWLTNGCFF
jgi:RimJ/RimL family protein N-acetyltransferase